MHRKSNDRNNSDTLYAPMVLKASCQTGPEGPCAPACGAHREPLTGTFQAAFSPATEDGLRC